MKETRHLCKHFDEWDGTCEYSCPYCSEPFSDEYCITFQKHCASEYSHPYPVTRSYYEPSEQIGFSIKTREMVIKKWGIRKGCVIAEWFIPDDEVEVSNVSIDDVMQFGREQVKRKFDESEYEMKFIHTIRGYIFPATKQIGTLFLGID